MIYFYRKTGLFASAKPQVNEIKYFVIPLARYLRYQTIRETYQNISHGSMVMVIVIFSHFFSSAYHLNLRKDHLLGQFHALSASYIRQSSQTRT